MRKGDHIRYHRWYHNLASGKQGTEIIEAIYQGKAKGTQYEGSSDYVVYNLDNGYECGIGKEQIIKEVGR